MSERDRKGGRPRIKIDELFDRLPPNAPEAEMSLLGSMILDPQVIADVLPHVSGADSFYMPAHGAIFQSLLKLYETHQSGDLVQLVDLLRAGDQLKDVGGEDYLVQLAEAVPTAVNAPHYAKIVGDKHRLRRLIDAAGKILYDAFHPAEAGESTTQILDEAEATIMKIAEATQLGEAESLADLLMSEIERLELIERTGVSGLKTGFYDLDEMLSGLQPGELVIVAARPSMGKTALALNVAEQVALGGVAPGQRGGDPVPVALFSLEMSKSAVTNRMLSARSGIDSHKMRTGKLRDSDFQKLNRAAGELGDAPLLIDDTPNLSVLGLRSRSRRLKHKHQIKAIVIDYLQLLTAPSAARESRQVEVSEISRGIKALARELEVPVICLAQLNRGPEQREGNRPRLADLRESGSIEQDADVVMLLHREEYFHINDPDWADDNPEKVGMAELIVAKQRNGPTGVVKLTWDSRTTRFKSYAAPQAADWARPSAQEAGGWQPKVEMGPGASPAPRPSTFHPGTPKGPIDGHRDGGGPDREWADDDIPI